MIHISPLPLFQSTIAPVPQPYIFPCNCSQLHAAQWDVRQPANRWAEKTAEVETIKHHSCNRQKMRQVNLSYQWRQLNWKSPQTLGSVEMNLWFCFQQLRFSTDEKNLLRLGVCMKMSLEYCCCSVHCCIWKLLDKNHPPLTCILSATWGKHMKPPAFKEIKETQKINHFPGKYHSSRSPTKRSSMVKI